MTETGQDTDPKQAEVTVEALTPEGEALLESIRLSEKPIAVIEIFGPTIQGEGDMIGVKTMFVRTGGCDYKCRMCDSLHAVIPDAIHKHKTMMKQEEIGLKLWEAKEAHGVEWVTISGGNPLAWDLTFLVDICHNFGMKVAVETQATLWQDWVAKCDKITLSPKSPGMGEKFIPEVFTKFLDKLNTVGTFQWGNVDKTCLKIVVFNQEDMDFALEVGEIFDNHELNQSFNKHAGLFLSVGNPFPPVLDENLDLVDNWKALEEAGVSNIPFQLMKDYKVMLEDYLQDPRFVNWRFLPQLHVLLYANETGK